MSRDARITKMLYGKSKGVSTLTEMSAEVASHKEVRDDIFNYLVTKGINKYRAGIVTNMIMNKAIYGVEYSPDVERMITLSLRDVAE